MMGWPWKASAIDRRKLDALIAASAGIKYGWGAKPGKRKRSQFVEADCSGYVQWLLGQLGVSGVPAGSWLQNQWLLDNNYKPTTYAMCGLSDDRLRIGYFPAKGTAPGHIWLCWNGQTIESYGGRGFGRRAWNTAVLLRNNPLCYVLTEPLV